MYNRAPYQANSVATPRSSAEARLDMCFQLMLLFGAVISIDLLTPAAAFAAITLSGEFGNIVTTISGSTGKALSIIACMALGIGALFGKISYIRAMALAVGVAMVFGAATIVSTLGAGTSGAPGGTTDAFSTSLFTALNAIIAIITGTAGKSLAIIAVMAVGIGAYFGKISYPQALILAVGIAVVFGAATIFTSLGVAAVTSYTMPATSTPIEKGLYTVVQSMVGATGIALATIAIIILGIGAMFGKISSPQALVFVVGIVLIFGGASLIGNLYTATTAAKLTQVTNPGAPSNQLVDVFIQLTNAMTSTAGLAIGTIAIMILGVGAMFGKISYPVALIFATGIALVFGAAAIVTNLQNALGTAIGISIGDTGQSFVSPVAAMLAQLVYFIEGSLGQWLGITAVVILGIGAFFGKISWPAAILVIVGIALIFGSVALVSFLNPDTVTAATTGTDCLTSTLANFANLLNGGSARALASVAVILLGVGAMLGKVSYPAALVLVTGIGTTFGANAIFTSIISPASPSGAGTEAISDALCNIVGLLTGNAGKAIATIAIIMLGIGAMLGKVSYHLALTIFVGIAVMFGAQTIATMLGFGTGCGSGAGTLPATSCH